jgi:hypothetical protein
MDEERSTSQEPQEPFGLMLEAARPADELRVGEIVTFNGHLVEVRPDPDTTDRVRLVLVRALGPPPGKGASDQREIEVVCPRDMAFSTATPYNLDLAAPSGLRP